MSERSVEARRAGQASRREVRSIGHSTKVKCARKHNFGSALCEGKLSYRWAIGEAYRKSERLGVTGLAGSRHVAP
jgi:hypothetical protein